MNKFWKGAILVTVVASSGVGLYLYKKHRDKLNEQRITVEDLGIILKDRNVKPEPTTEEETFYEDEPIEEEKHVRKGTDPNSAQAYEQFVSMQTADLVNKVDLRTMVRRLFSKPFEPRTSGDAVLFDALVDERENFFGPVSKWNKQVTWGDVILHYSRKMSFNLEDSVECWVNYIITNLDIAPNVQEVYLDNLLESIGEHNFVSHANGLYGLFGLDDDGYAFLRKSLEYTIEQKVTLELEYNAFLKMAMEDEE